MMHHQSELGTYLGLDPQNEILVHSSDVTQVAISCNRIPELILTSKLFPLRECDNISERTRALRASLALVSFLHL